jgi:hypothetical protein
MPDVFAELFKAAKKSQPPIPQTHDKPMAPHKKRRTSFCFLEPAALGMAV